MASMAEVSIKLSAIDELSPKLQQIEKEFGVFDRIGGTLQNVGVQMAAMGAAIGGPLIAAVKTFAEFEQQMTNVATVAGATEEEFNQLTEAAQRVGETTKFSASEAAQGLYSLASAGMSAGDQIASLDGVAALAAATNADLAKSSETMVSVLSQFGMEAKEAGKVADIFATAISKSQASLPKLADSMRYAGTIAGSLGQPLESVGAALMTMYDAGLKGEQAGTALRNILNTLVNPAKAASEALKSMGVSMSDIDPRTKSLAEVVGKLKDSGVDAASAMKIFGSEAGPAMAALLQEGEQGIRDYEQALRDSGGAAEAMAEQQMGTLQGMFKMLKSQFEGIAIEVGKALVPMVEAFANGIKKLLDWWNSLSDGLKKGITQFAAVAAIVGVVGGSITALVGTVIKAVGVWKQFGAIMSTVFSQKTLDAIISFGKWIFDMGKKLITTAGSAGALKTALAGIGVGIAAGAVFAFISKLKQEIDELTGEVRVMNDEWKKTFGDMEVEGNKALQWIPLIGNALYEADVSKILGEMDKAAYDFALEINGVAREVTALSQSSNASKADMAELADIFTAIAGQADAAGGASEAFGQYVGMMKDVVANAIVQMDAFGISTEGLIEVWDQLLGGSAMSNAVDSIRGLGLTVQDASKDMDVLGESTAKAAANIMENLNSIRFDAIETAAEGAANAIGRFFDAAAKQAANSMGVIDAYDFSGIVNSVKRASQDVLSILVDMGVDSATALAAIDQIDWTDLKMTAEEAKDALINIFQTAGMSAEKALEEANKFDFDKLREASKAAGDEVGDAFDSAKNKAISDLQTINEMKFDVLKANLSDSVTQAVEVAESALNRLKQKIEEINNSEIHITATVDDE